MIAAAKETPVLIKFFAVNNHTKPQARNPNPKPFLIKFYGVNNPSAQNPNFETRNPNKH